MTYREWPRGAQDLLAVLFRLRRGREALEASKQVFLRHAVELRLDAEFDLRLGVGVDHWRRGLGLGLVDLDVLLQGVNQILTQVAGRELAVADFAQGDNGIFVVVPRAR